MPLDTESRHRQRQTDQRERERQRLLALMTLANYPCPVYAGEDGYHEKSLSTYNGKWESDDIHTRPKIVSAESRYDLLLHCRSIVDILGSIVQLLNTEKEWA